MIQSILYINKKPEKMPLLYEEVVEYAIKQGIRPKAAYIYLAGMGIRSRNCRITEGERYSPIMKIAVKGDKPITLITITPPEIEVLEL